MHLHFFTLLFILLLTQSCDIYTTSSSTLTQYIAIQNYTLLSPCSFNEHSSNGEEINPTSAFLSERANNSLYGYIYIVSNNTNKKYQIDKGLTQAGLMRSLYCWIEKNEDKYIYHLVWDDRKASFQPQILYHGIIQDDSISIKQFHTSADWLILDRSHAKSVTYKGSYLIPIHLDNGHIGILQYKNDKWEIIETGIRANNYSLESINNEELCLVFDFPANLSQIPDSLLTNGSYYDKGSVFISCTYDLHLSSWEAPRLIAYSGNKAVFPLYTAVDSDSNYRLIWGTSEDGKQLTQYFNLKSSNDYGKTWSSDIQALLNDLSISEHNYEQRFIVDQKNNGHIFSTLFNESTNQYNIYHARQTKNGWQESRLLSPLQSVPHHIYRFDVVLNKSRDTAIFTWVQHIQDSTGNWIHEGVIHHEPL